MNKHGNPQVDVRFLRRQLIIVSVLESIKAELFAMYLGAILFES